LRVACDHAVADDYSLETVTVMDASHDKRDTILVTPTLVIESPAPRRRYVGELLATETDQLLQQLLGESTW